MPNETLELGKGLRPTPRDKRDYLVGALFQLPSVNELPSEFELTGYFLKDQIADKNTDFCSGYVVDSISELQEGVELWPQWGFAASKEITGDPESWGQNLRDAFKRAVKYGSVEKKDAVKVNNPRLLSDYPKELLEKAKKHKKQTYLAVNPAMGMDAFDTIRATIWRFRDEKRAVGIGVQFGWSLSDKIINTVKKGNGHAMFVSGWDGDYLKVVNSAGPKAGNNGVHLFSREVINYYVDIFGAYMLVDMPREDIEYMLDYDIKYEDNWVKQLAKVVWTIFTSPFLTKNEKSKLIDMTTEVIKNQVPTLSKREQLLKAANDWLGKDASVTNIAPDDLACAESVSNIIKASILPNFPICISTADLKTKLDQYFTPTLDIEPGHVLMSPTGKGNGSIPNGHTGIFLTKDRIASNSSSTGLWTDNYSLKEWIDRYRTKGGYPLYVYKPKE